MTSETRPVVAVSSPTPRSRAARIEPPLLRMTVAPIGLLMLPLRMMSDDARFRICTSVGATVRSTEKVSGTFGPFRSTSGFCVVFTTSILLIFSGRFQALVISTWRKVSLKVQWPPSPSILSVAVPA